MSPSANGPKSMSSQNVFIVERRAEFREVNSRLIVYLDQQPYEPKISYLDNAYVDEQQAYAAAIREQIAELEDIASYVTASNSRKIAAQSTMSLKDRLRSIHKEVDAAETPVDPKVLVVKFGVLEFGLAPQRPFQENELLSGLEFQSESDDVEAEDEEGDEEGEVEEEEEDDGEEGEEEVESEEEVGEEDLEEDDDGEAEVEGEEEQEGEEDDDDEEDAEDEEDVEEVDDEEEDPLAAPQPKKQKT